MEDILASIRRILNEEEAKPSAEQVAEPDVLELDQSMMLPDPEPPTHQAPDAGAIPEPGPVRPPPEFTSAVPAAVPLPPSVAVPMPPPTAVPLPPQLTLVAPEAVAATAVSVGALMQTLATQRSTAVHRGGPTIEDLVREEIRPLMKEWLDTHLPPLVERLVRAEIERVVSRMS
jgi:cell pole-organizing protein PopZ